MNAVTHWLIGGVLLMALTTASADSRAKNMPDSINLDSMEHLYEKVIFNHAGHIRLIKDCAVCHHHTTGTLVEDTNCVRCHNNSGATSVVTCKGCHSAQPFSAETIRKNRSNLRTYHNDKLGLKGAYHQNCTGCHAKNGGPTGCQDCHPRKKEGDAFYNAGEQAPKAQEKGKSRGNQ